MIVNKEDMPQPRTEGIAVDPGTLQKALWCFFPFGLALAAASCSILGPGENKVKVVNETGAPIVFLAMELQASYLFDPAPSIPVEGQDARILPPGARRSLSTKDIDGPFRIGDDLRFFLYEVVGGTARSRSIVTLTARDLRASDYRVSFDEL